MKKNLIVERYGLTSKTIKPISVLTCCSFTSTSRGNIIGQYPYKAGTPCTKCASGKGFCYKNLCSKYEYSGLSEDHFQRH